MSRLRRRYAAERRFKWYGIIAIGIALAMLCWLLVSIGIKSVSGFSQTYVELDVYVDEEIIDPDGTRDRSVIGGANFQRVFSTTLYDRFPEVTDRGDRRELRAMISPGAGFDLRQRVLADPSLIGQTVTLTVPVTDPIDQLRKANIDRTLPENRRPVSDAQLAWYDVLDAEERIETRLNFGFLTSADSRLPELAGIGGAIAGSALTLLVCLSLAFPIGISAAVYLEEFAPKNRLTDIIEVNINNLAAVPSIVFGLLGLAIFLQFHRACLAPPRWSAAWSSR